MHRCNNFATGRFDRTVFELSAVSRMETQVISRVNVVNLGKRKCRERRSGLLNKEKGILSKEKVTFAPNAYRKGY